MSRYRGRKSDNPQGIGFIIIICACALASGLFEAYPLPVSATVLTGMVLVGGYLVWRSNQ
jgi:hypothetical protein